MKSRLVVWPVLVFLFASSAPGGVQALSASAAPHHRSACGDPRAAPSLREPPDVDVGRLPRNAAGEHELILAVHRDGDRFCYRYDWDGTSQTDAPAIHVRPGEHFAIRIVNDIASQSKGERVASSSIPPCMPMPMAPEAAVHYAGYLNHTLDDRYMAARPLDTNLHLHGFEGPAPQENVFLSTLSTPMHACEYHITIPATQPAGTYFYHPHVHGASELQVALGLSGPWIVEPARSELPRSEQHVLVLRYRLPMRDDNPFAPDDSALGKAAARHEGTLKSARPVRYDPFDPPPWPLSFPVSGGAARGVLEACDGSGSEALVSVNGADAPQTLTVPAGVTQLLRIVNATSDSAKALQLEDRAGRVRALHVAEFDGVPVSSDSTHPLARYLAMKSVMVAPSARVDVLVTVAQGQTLTLSSAHFCDGHDGFYQLHHELVRIEATTEGARPVSQLTSTPVRIRDTAAARLLAFVRANPQRVRRRAMTFTQYRFPKRGKIPEHLAFYITDTSRPGFHEHPYWPVYRPGSSAPANADVVVKAGTVEEWYLINATMEAHAFHIHQMSFVQEHSAAGAPLSVDMAFVPVGKLLRNRSDPNYPLVRPSITKVLLDFRHVPRGTFVFHCHMLFHEDHGMMGIVRVE